MRVPRWLVADHSPQACDLVCGRWCQALDADYSYAADGAPRPLELRYARAVDVFSHNAEYLQLWLSTDEQFALGKARELFASPTSLQSPYQCVEPLIAGSRARSVASDTSLATPHTAARVRPTVCGEGVVSLLRTIAARFRVFRDPDSELRFITQIAKPLLQELEDWLREAASECNIAEAAPASQVAAPWGGVGGLALTVGCVSMLNQSWKQYMSIANTAHYVATIVADWAEEPFLAKLFEAMCQRSEVSQPRSRSGIGHGVLGSKVGMAAARCVMLVLASWQQLAVRVCVCVCVCVCVPHGPGDSVVRAAKLVKDSHTAAEVGKIVAGGSVIGPANALKALSSAIAGSSLTRSALTRCAGAVPCASTPPWSRLCLCTGRGVYSPGPHAVLQHLMPAIL